MYIEPNSVIHVLHNVPLDTTYDHTIYFDLSNPTSGKTNQYNTFYSLKKYSYEKQTYQRVKRGYIRVRQNANDLYDCNYLMFQNTSYGNKWFYAFIKSVEYINDNVAEIEFEIDPMQTWYFDYEFEQCFVIREHSETDNIGDNLVPEDVNTGEYVSGYPVTTENFTNWKIVVVATAELDQGLPGLIPATGGYYAGVFGSAHYYVFSADATGMQSIRTLLRNLSLLSNVNAIAGMYMCPASMIPADPQTMTDYVTSKNDAYNRIPNFTVPFDVEGNTSVPGVNFTLFGGYTPKNNKLYTYPYNYFICSNQQGETEEFKYEYFDKTIGLQFHMVCDYGVDPCVTIAPIGYLQKRQAGTTIEENLQKTLSIRNFPKCTYATNDFGAKLVQGGINLALLAATKGASATYTGNIKATPPIPVAEYPNFNTPALPTGGNLAQYNNQQPLIGKTVNDTSVTAKLHPIDALVLGYIAKGVMNAHMTNNVGAGNTMFIFDGFDFIFKQVFLDAPFARIVDDYFTAFGYACNKLKKPNISARPHWNYIRTANCTIKGSIPCDDMNKICKIYNNGITFWKNINEVGNYNLPNSPV